VRKRRPRYAGQRTEQPQLRVGRQGAVDRIPKHRRRRLDTVERDADQTIEPDADVAAAASAGDHAVAGPDDRPERR
jgi:hypothetical protein